MHAHEKQEEAMDQLCISFLENLGIIKASLQASGSSALYQACIKTT
jgi:hypothetical protein